MAAWTEYVRQKSLLDDEKAQKVMQNGGGIPLLQTFSKKGRFLWQLDR